MFFQYKHTNILQYTLSYNDKSKSASCILHLLPSSPAIFTIAFHTMEAKQVPMLNDLSKQVLVNS